MPRNEETVTIRVPAGLKKELTALTGVNFSKYARTLLVSALNIERNKVSKKESTP